MKPWLRLTLITVTVGGGFTGVAITFQALFSAQKQPLAYVLIFAFLALFAFVTVSGLIFVHDPQRTTPLIYALALQIPWVSSPVLVYKFTAGFQVFVTLIGGRIDGGFRLGSDFQIRFLQQFPWGVGVNLFAVVLLVLLFRAEMPDNVQQPTGSTLGVSETADQASSTASAPPPFSGCG